MFSSVQAGVAALAPTHAGFFIFRSTTPSSGPRYFVPYTGAFGGQDGDAVHPVCAGIQGHPPLLSSKLRTRLLAETPLTHLRAFLEETADAMVEVEVVDLTTLLDMDTPRDLAALSRFAAFLDGRGPGVDGDGEGGASGGLPESAVGACDPRLAEADALYLFEVLQTPERVVAHCRAVAPWVPRWPPHSKPGHRGWTPTWCAPHACCMTW